TSGGEAVQLGHGLERDVAATVDLLTQEPGEQIGAAAAEIADRSALQPDRPGEGRKAGLLPGAIADQQGSKPGAVGVDGPGVGREVVRRGLVPGHGSSRLYHRSRCAATTGPGAPAPP